MTKQHAIPSEEDIQLFVDGRLEAARHDRVAAAIAKDFGLTQRVSELKGLGEAMHRVYDPILDEPVPAQMLRTVMDNCPAPLFRLAAAIAWVAIGAVIGGVTVQQTRQQPAIDTALARPLPQEAIFAHVVYAPEVRHPVEVTADERAHLNAWLSKRLAHPVVSPDIRAAGYQLVGGRLLPDAGRPAAQFMYEDENGARITLYVRGHGKNARDTALRYAKYNDVAQYGWSAGLRTGRSC